MTNLSQWEFVQFGVLNQPLSHGNVNEMSSNESFINEMNTQRDRFSALYAFNETKWQRTKTREYGNDGGKSHPYDIGLMKHVSIDLIFVCVLKYASFLFYFSHWFISLFFLFMLYTSFRASKIYWSYRIFRMDLFVCFSSFSSTNWLLFLMVMFWLCVYVCANMIKYFIIYLLFQNVNDFHMCVCVIYFCVLRWFLFLYVRIHILFRTIWIHITNFKREKNIFSNLFELLCWEFHFIQM